MDIKKVIVMGLALTGATYLAIKENGTMAHGETKILPTPVQPDHHSKMISTPVAEGYRVITFKPM